MWGLRDSIVPQRLRITHDFMTSFPYCEMVPANDAVSANEVEIDGAGYRTNFCLAKPRERYLVFSLLGGDLALTLDPGVHYRVIHLDPRTGQHAD